MPKRTRKKDVEKAPALVGFKPTESDLDILEHLKAITAQTGMNTSAYLRLLIRRDIDRAATGEALDTATSTNNPVPTIDYQQLYDAMASAVAGALQSAPQGIQPDDLARMAETMGKAAGEAAGEAVAAKLRDVRIVASAADDDAAPVVAGDGMLDDMLAGLESWMQ